MKKRIFSLLLSIALCLSLLSPALAADPTRFTDAKDIQYWDAVAALAQLGVIEGKPDGAFHPADGITRAEAAKLFFVIANGEKDEHYDLADSKSKSSHYDRFCADCADAVGHWAEKYFQWCWIGGGITGLGNGSCDPDGSVTSLEFAKMILQLALFYDPVDYNYFGEEWAESVNQLALDLDLYRGLPEEMIPRQSPDGSWEAPLLDRESAAQMLYTALQTKIHGMLGTWGDVTKDVGEYTSADWDGNGITLIQAAFKLRGVESLDLPAQPTE